MSWRGRGGFGEWWRVANTLPCSSGRRIHNTWRHCSRSAGVLSVKWDMVTIRGRSEKIRSPVRSFLVAKSPFPAVRDERTWHELVLPVGFSGGFTKAARVRTVSTVRFSTSAGITWSGRSRNVNPVKSCSAPLSICPWDAIADDADDADDEPPAAACFLRLPMHTVVSVTTWKLTVVVVEYKSHLLSNLVCFSALPSRFPTLFQRLVASRFHVFYSLDS